MKSKISYATGWWVASLVGGGSLRLWVTLETKGDVVIW